MATQPAEQAILLYLDRITLRDVPNRQYTLRLFVGNEEIELQNTGNRSWTPAKRQDVSSIFEIRAEIQMRTGYFFWAKNKQNDDAIDIKELLKDHWGSTEHAFMVPKAVTIGKYHGYLELRFSANTTAESLSALLQKLEDLLKEYSPMMSRQTERVVDETINNGAVFAEFDPIAKAIFGLANVTLELLKEHNKYYQVPPSLFDILRRVLPLADKVVEEIVCEETDILEDIIPRMFKVMQRVAEYSCDYVRRGRLASTVSGLVDQGTIEEMERDLTKVIEDFGHAVAVNVEVLQRTRETEQELLLRRLKPVKATYHQDFGSMEGTQESPLKQLMDWATREPRQEESNTYWIYGLPMIEKTSLAHSICASLQEGNHLAGGFFCRRDDVDLSEPRNILPTLIHQLAIIFPPFRRLVAERLRNEPSLTPASMEHSLLLDLIRKLLRPPNRPIVFVIDAVDECGDALTRPGILRALTDTVAHAPWLKIIITSRPEVDICHFFDALVWSSHERYDLDADKEAPSDLRIFAQTQFELVASKRLLPSPWPERSLLNRVISRAAGHYAFIETIARTLEQCEDPTEHLKATLEDSAGTGLTSLYGLYSSILKAQIVHSTAEFRRMIGVLLAAAPHRPICEETIAELAGVRLDLVRMWVANLGSLLYRDEEANGGIRIRHLSISVFFLRDDCHSDFHVDLRDANVELGIACLRKMIEQLRFNICKLEDSRLANADVHDLPWRIKENISDALQYSSLYWSNHLCFGGGNGDQHVWESLRKFFEGPHGLFWVEVLSIMGMVSIGVSCLQRVISIVKYVDLALAERIEDVCRFIDTFQAAISMSAPHTYISAGPFLPSESILSATVFSTWFTKGMRIQGGRLLSWPSPPLEWIGHTDRVRCVSYSHDGHYIASGSSDQTIRIWDAKTGSAVGKPLKGHTDEVSSVAYSPDGRHITSGSSDKTIRIWDVETRSPVGKPLEGHTGAVLSVDYSPDGRYIISGSFDKTVRMWDAETGTAVGKPLEGHADYVRSVAYSPGGRHIISGSDDKTIRMWDSRTGSAVGKPLEGHTDWVWCVAYSPDGRYIISGSLDKTIRIWDAETGAAVGKPLEGHTDWVWSVDYSPDGRHIISGAGDNTIRIWDAETGSAVGKPLEGHSDMLSSVAYSPDGRHIISGSNDKTIRIWDGWTGSAAGRPLEGHTDRVPSVAYSPDGRHIISGSLDKTMRIWDADTGSAVGETLEGHACWVLSVAYSPDGRHVISGSLDKTIRMWDAENGSAVGKPLEGHMSRVRSVAYSPNGRHIISGSFDQTIRIWDADTGSAVGTPLKGHTSWVRSVAYSPDGLHIISGSDDKTIRMWDAENGSAVGKPFKGHTSRVRSVAYSPDGRHIISGSDDGTIRIWDAENGSAVGEPLEGHTDAVFSVAYSPDGRHIISGSLDKTIRRWDAETGSAVGKPLEGHTDSVLSVAYSPNGRYITSGSSDMTIRVWDAETESGVGIQPFLDLHGKPDSEGWVRDPEGGLIYWVPLDCRIGLHSPALITIPLTSHFRSVSLDFTHFAFGTSWTHVFSPVQP